MITNINFAELNGISRLQIQLGNDTPLSDEAFFRFCQQNRTLKFEKTKERKIIAMTPTGLETSGRNSDINLELGIWNRQVQYGKVFDSNGGFTLPDGSVLAPDAAVVSQQRWDALPQAERKKFGRLCPEFVIELKSEHDRVATLQAKMQDWIHNGVQLGWLIDPEEEVVYIYQPQKAVIEVKGFDQKVLGDPVLPGFELDLSVLR